MAQKARAGARSLCLSLQGIYIYPRSVYPVVLIRELAPGAVPRRLAQEAAGAAPRPPAICDQVPIKIRVSDCLAENNRRVGNRASLGKSREQWSGLRQPLCPGTRNMAISGENELQKFAYMALCSASTLLSRSSSLLVSNRSSSSSVPSPRWRPFGLSRLRPTAPPGSWSA